jgi:hypothetical protein
MLMLYLLSRTIADHAVSQGASRVSIEAQVAVNNGAVSGNELRASENIIVAVTAWAGLLEPAADEERAGIAMPHRSHGRRMPA